MKLWAQRVLLVCISSVITLGVLVALDRWLGMELNRGGYFMPMQPEQLIKYQTSEFTIEVRLSGQGLRNGEVLTPKPEGVYRILALGDSFTFGWGVEEDQSWPRLVERGLRARGLKVEVINAGVPGIGQYRNRLVCQAYAHRLEVDAFILGLSSDDFLQSLSRRDTKSTVKTMSEFLWPTLMRLPRRTIEPLEPVGESEEPIEANWIWREWVKIALKRQPGLLLNLDSELRSDFVAGRLHPYVVFAAQSHPDLFMDLTRVDYVRGALGRLGEQLGKLKQECTQDRPVMVVFLPPAAIISQDYFDALRQVGYVVDQKLVSSDVSAPLGLVVKGQGFGYVSLVPAFRQDGCLNCFFPYDGHLTVEGNRRGGEIILPQLLQQLDEFLPRE